MKLLLVVSILTLIIIVWLPAFPGWPIISGFLAVFAFMFTVCHRRIGQVIVGLCLSIVVGFWHMERDVEALSLNQYADEPVVIEGQIVSVVDRQKRFNQPYAGFDLAVSKADSANLADDNQWPSLLEGRRIRVAWHNVTSVPQLGQRYRLVLRLKPLVSLHNRGGVDYVRSRLAEDVVLKGSVVSTTPPVLQPAVFNTFWLRSWVRQRLLVVTAGMSSQPLLIALSVGDRSLISPFLRQRLIDLGVAHLLVVSGLHIGLAATIGFYLVMLPARLFIRPLLWRYCELTACMSAASLALFYTLISGFGIASIRALIMVLVVLFCRLSWRRTLVWQSWLLALWFVLLLEPLQLFSAGLWLSFSAVFALIYLSIGRYGKGWLALQLGLFVMMVVPSAVFFSQLPLLAPLANVVAVPVISFVVVPLLLLATVTAMVSLSLAIPIFGVCELLMSTAQQFIVAMPLSATVIKLPALSPAVSLFFLLGAMVLLIPRGLPGRWLGGVLMLPLFLEVLYPPPPAFFTMTVLDVGQGLAVVIQTPAQVVVYDTGFGDGQAFSIGGRVVGDWLQQNGIDHIDYLIVSHGDSDHAGGVGELIRRFSIGKIISPQQDWRWQSMASRWQACSLAPNWSAAGTRFSLLQAKAVTGDNNHSCVLLIATGNTRLLLTGDIEREAELYLLNSGVLLSADVMVVPHHGSKTSSSPAFINAVSPVLAIISAGQHNRFSHPNPAVRRRYLNRGVRLLSTASSGQIDLTKLAPDQKITVQTRRCCYRHYWQ
ncbi:hypothetical protein SIN8267_00078 [Sinobacterium norvegicum]|uniref:Metallo-beta-lactamase domain-containing protein n=1 Tax=Sinobacterium norvegicum TaxID=1641715 RepID=A0ABM9AAG8_9GAMM|nr:DNA internalization-related competence protein ComEC/Rec2 [Sinobacterium norvegicum]CAH0990001.1 hypothetical protein SIN8267_00078 [Sinobacterium norvegicum]